ncbi:hypothetical protein ACOMHN_010936 [Nucella lapillus]
MEIVTSNKGGAEISYQGFIYTKKATKKTRIRWECSQRKGLSCKGAITTDLNNEDIQVSTMHSHEADPHAVEVVKLRGKIRTQSQQSAASGGHLTQILASALVETTDPVKARLSRMDTLKRSIRHQRRGALPKDPASLREIEIPHEWRTTGGPDPQPFLMHDSGSDSGPQRMIIFATDRKLRHLARADEWFMDGNFSMAPDHFCQLYVIRAPVGDTCVSCVYALLPNKTQETYEQMLQAILDRCDESQLMPDPSQVIVDYEKAVIQALHSKLGEHVEVKGCFFHLTQSTWRRIRQLGMTALYNNNDDVKLFCGMLDALAFLPVDEVPTGMEYLHNNTPDGAEELLEYFEATYVRGTFRQVQLPAANDDAPAPVRVRRIPPLFPPGLWNVHEATMRDRNRTNNQCEAWNLGFLHLVGHNHPSLWTLINALQMDYALVCTSLLQDARGEPPRKRVKRSSKDLQTRLKAICTQHRDGVKTLEEALRALGHCIRF